MKPGSLNTAVELSEKLEHVFVATADSSGMPHVAAASKLSQTSESQVTVSAWFCPGTTAETILILSSIRKRIFPRINKFFPETKKHNHKLSLNLFTSIYYE